MKIEGGIESRSSPMEQVNQKDKAEKTHYFTCLCRSVVDIEAKTFASNAPVPRDKIPHLLISVEFDWYIGCKLNTFPVNL